MLLGHPLRLHLSWCVLHIVHVLKGWCPRPVSRSLLRLKLLKLAHLVLQVPQVLILGVVCINPPIAIYHTTTTAKLLRADGVGVDFPYVWGSLLLTCSICLLHAGEVGRGELTLAAITPLPAAVRTEEDVVTLGVILSKVVIAAHAVA